MSSLPWSVRSLAAEAARNVVSARYRSTVFALLAASLVGALIFAEVVFAESVLKREAEFRAAGGFVVVVSSPKGIDASHCVALADATAVRYSGTVRNTGRVALSRAPQTFVPRFSVTPGFVAILDGGRFDSTTRMGAVLVGEVLADHFGLRSGALIRYAHDGPVYAVADSVSTIRNPEMARSVLDVETGGERADACWVEVSPGVSPWIENAVLAAVAPADELANATRVVRRGDFAFDPVETIGSRPQRSFGLLVGGVMAVLVWLSVWFRRSELGIYRALGCGPSHLAVLIGLETSMQLIPGALWGGIWGYSFALAYTQVPIGSEVLAFAVTSSMQAIFVALMLAPLSVLSVMSRIPDMLKDR